MRRPRLPLGLGLARVPGHRGRLRDRLPSGLKESDKLREPIFTPATKAELGEHDENIDFDRAAEIIGDRQLMEELRRISIEIYRRAADHAASAGSSSPTPSSSSAARRGGDRARRRGADPGLLALLARRGYEPGRGQASFDKQYVRDYSTRPAGTTAPGPELPDEVVQNTRAKYVEAYERITGEPLERLARPRRAREGEGADPAEGGILDPQGKAVERALPALGFEASRTSAWAGLSSSTSRIPRSSTMCEKLLANPLIEDYEIVGRQGNEVRRASASRVRATSATRSRPCSGSARRASSGTRDRTSRESTPSSSPAASPTATTCAPGRSRASRR